MALPVCHETKFVVADGASTNRKTVGASPRLPEGLIVRWICVEMPAATPPVLVGVHIFVLGKAVELISEWVRGGHEGALIKELYLPIPKETEFFFAAQNDTGSERTLTAHWITERMVA